MSFSRAYGVVVSMSGSHHGDQGSNPCWGGEMLISTFKVPSGSNRLFL